MDNFYDAVILGAGPAGLSTALSLAEFNWKVLVVDKSRFPRDKVCGGFVGPENQWLLDRYGVSDRLLQERAQKVSEYWITGTGESSVDLPVCSEGQPSFGWGFSRKNFDHVLYLRALEMGVQFLTACTVDGVRPITNAKGYELTVRQLAAQQNTMLSVKTFQLIYAYGAVKVPAKEPSYVGMGALFENVDMKSKQVVLHLAHGGHVGMNHFEDNLVNVCYLVEKKLSDQFQASPQALLEVMARDNSHIQRALAGASRKTPWKGMLLPFRSEPRFGDEHSFYVGDAVDVVHPVVGGGITMALYGGWILGQLMGSQPSAEQFSRNDVMKRYKEFWIKKFGLKVQLSKWLGRLAHQPWLANKVLYLLQKNQHLSETLFQIYHSKPPKMVLS